MMIMFVEHGGAPHAVMICDVDMREHLAGMLSLVDDRVMVMNARTAPSVS